MLWNDAYGRADDDVLQELWFEASEMDAFPVMVDADVKIDEGLLVDIQENGEFSS